MAQYRKGEEVKVWALFYVPMDEDWPDELLALYATEEEAEAHGYTSDLTRYRVEEYTVHGT
jgi:hypothetical protein